MKSIVNISVLLFSIVIFSCGNGSKNGESEKGDTLSLVHEKVTLADPFIMLYHNTYYAYGTNSDEGIEVYTSNDLREWKLKGLALNKKDVWGERWFWAPEVYEINGVFYMYYSANEHICVATSDSPLGPFTQKIRKPMIENEKCIDNSLFIDEDGTPYLFFDRFNDDTNPLLQKPEGLVGVGHSAMFVDKEGSLRIVYHAHKDMQHIHPRAMYIGKVDFVDENGIAIMKISQDYIVPHLVK